MAWNGRQQALQLTNIEAFRSYLQSLNFSSWKPSGIVLHNTASPTYQQWWHSGTPPNQRIKNLKDYYQSLGWSAGPHAFNDGVSWWIFTDWNKKGVHSPSWNGTRLGVEMVGDFDKENPYTDPCVKVWDATVAMFGEALGFFGWDCNGTIIKLHKEDPRTTHACPGRLVTKDRFLADVTNYISEGGDHGQEPEEPRSGVVSGIGPGDRLNIRALASSSAPPI